MIPLGVTREGAFTLQPDDPGVFALDPEHLPEVHDNGTRVSFPESAATREFTLTDANGTRTSLGDVDIVFPIMHGPWGEDGTIQGLLELLALPYVGSGVLASALGMDKHFTKTVLERAGIPVVPWLTVRHDEWVTDYGTVQQRATSLGLPVFVKPARAGSSVGVTRVVQWDHLDAALATAFEHDNRVLIETAVTGRELEIGVLGAGPNRPVRVSVPGEVVLGQRDFYDFAAKYLNAPGIDLVCPASLTEEEATQMGALAIRAFGAIGGEGLARVDFFLTEAGFVVNEINTMPGFTPISMFPRCWRESGMAYPDLITELIDLGLALGDRHSHRAV